MKTSHIKCKYRIKLYRLEMILAVGYRVKGPEVQNKLLFVVTEKTAAEIVVSRDDSGRRGGRGRTKLNY